MKVLIVEDDPLLGKTLADILQHQGYEPLLASTGEEGIARIASTSGLIAVVLVDLRLPDTDGVSVLQAIKGASPLTEVIILTGYASLDTAVASLKERAFDYLQKPVAPKTLLKAVEQAVDRSARRQTEEALRQLKALQELAGAAAHELNQPLQAILGSIALALMQCGHDHPSYSDLLRIQEEVRRMASIVQQMQELTEYRTKPYVGQVGILDLTGQERQESKDK